MRAEDKSEIENTKRRKHNIGNDYERIQLIKLEVNNYNAIENTHIFVHNCNLDHT